MTTLKNPGLHHEEWAQEEMAAFHRFEENLRQYHCVVRKEAWPLSAVRNDLFTCSRCKEEREESVSIIFCQERHGSL